MLRGTNQEHGRPFNRRIILETIRREGPISRAGIARRIGLSAQAVSIITRELEEQGFLTASREEPQGRGQPASLLSLAPEGGFGLGFQLLPGRLDAVLVNLAGETVAKASTRLQSSRPALVFDEIARLTVSLRSRSPGRRILGAGLAMPGPFGVAGMSFVGPTTMEGWDGVPITDRLADATGLPAFMAIDAAAAATGESLFGAGRGFRHFFYIHFGAGLGGALVSDGAVVQGAWGNAGEIGHMPLDPCGDPCPCGNQGCIERVVSADALMRRLAADGQSCAAGDLAALSTAKPDVIASWLADAVPLLRRAIVIIENLCDPEAIIVGGILPDDIRARLLAGLAPLPPSISVRADQPHERIIDAPSGSDAVLKGAAVMAMHGILSPRLGSNLEALGDDAADPLLSDPRRPAPRDRGRMVSI